MEKRLNNRRPSFDHNQLDNEMSIPIDIKQECSNFHNINTAIDTSVYSTFTISEITSESINEFEVTIFEDGNEEDLLQDVIDQCHIPSNTISKEEIDIEDEPSVPISEMDETRAINPMENRNEVPITKNQKVVRKSWQKDAVFQRESDALDAIRNEKIWTNSSDRMSTCSKAIYGCSNFQSDGSRCDAGIYLQYSQLDSSVTLFRSTHNHTCGLIDSYSEPLSLLDSSMDSNMEIASKSSNESIEKIISTTETIDERRIRMQRERSKRYRSKKMALKNANVALDRSMDSNMEIASKSSKGSIEKNIPVTETKDKRKRNGRQRSMHYRSEQTALRKANAEEKLCKDAKKQKVVRKSWQKDAVFQRESDALDAIRNEKIWTNSSDRTGTCSKAIYGCSNLQSDGSHCDAGIYLQYSQVESSVTLFRSTNKHTCDLIESYSEPLSLLDSSMDSNMEITSKSSNESIEKIISTTETIDERRIRMQRERSKRYRSKKMALRKANAEERLHQHALLETIDIDNEPSVLISEMNETQTEAFNPMENRNEDPITKKQKVVRKSWQKDTVFERESDALDVIRSEKIWTNSSDMMGTCSKAIYGCSNLQSDGSHCDAGIYLQYSQLDSFVTMFRSTNKHTCNLIESNSESLPALISSTNCNLEIASKSSKESIEEIVSTTERKDERRKKIRRKCAKRNESILMGFLTFNGSMESNGNIDDDNFLALSRTDIDNEEDPLNDIADRCQLPSNTILKEEINIECEPNLPTSKMDETQAEAINPMENRNEEPVTKNQKVVCKSWQKGTVFQRENDALDAIRSEKIWTNSSDRISTCSKAIYGCNNFQSDGSRCDAGIYLQYSQLDSSVTLFRSTNKHTCHLIESYSEPLSLLDSSMDSNMEITSKSSNESIEKIISTTETIDERRIRMQRERSKRYRSKKMALRKANAEERLHQHALLETIDIDNEPSVLISEMNETQTEAFNPMENRKEDPITKKQKVVRKSWQKDAVFQRESDALDAIRNEKIWTNSSDRTGTCSKAIYGCSNLQSDGSHCDAGIYLQYSQVESSVTLFRSTNKHTCDLIESYSEPLSTLDSSMDINMEIARKSSSESIEKIISTTETIDERRIRMQRESSKRYRSKQMALRKANAEERLYQRTLLETIDIDNEPSVLISEMNETQTEAFNPMENRNEDPITKKQKVVRKRWQNDAVFQRESDALDAIKSEKIWTNSSDRTGTCSKAIYGCSNLQSDGSHCDAGIYLQYSQVESSVTLFRSTNKHTCDLIESNSESLPPLDSSIYSYMEITSKSSKESIEEIISTTEKKDERNRRIRRECSKRYRLKQLALKEDYAEERLPKHALPTSEQTQQLLQLEVKRQANSTSSLGTLNRIDGDTSCDIKTMENSYEEIIPNTETIDERRKRLQREPFGDRRPRNSDGFLMNTSL